MKHCLTLFFLLFFTFKAWPQIEIFFNPSSDPVFHGVKKLKKVLLKQGKDVLINPPRSSGNAELRIRIVDDSRGLTTLQNLYSGFFPEMLRKEGYWLIRSESGKDIFIAGKEPVGAMYGIFDLIDNTRAGKDFSALDLGLKLPGMQYRIIKFNLPWSPYRDSEATRLHLQTCRDLDFWEDFLDMMVENRFNVLSLWNLHPFPYMIRARNYPEATPFNDQELKDWQKFWRNLFRMAKERGIQTFIVNWNIVVSEEFAEAYGADRFNDRSELVKKYTRESVTQVINEYKDLTGIGVTLADWMNNFEGNMTPSERENWILETFVTGMKRANRKVKFLHRSVLSGSPLEMRRVIDLADLNEPALVEVKFNWSHGHSTPKLAITHDYHSGKVDDRFWNPRPSNYNIQWMVRNEDFFILRWGQPDFIRDHMRINNRDFVNGYFIGSEGYIPALDYSHKILPEKTWHYGFEKQWLFYRLWGRLLYDPETPDALFESDFNFRYGITYGDKILEAYKLASNMPLQLASFYRSTWDYTLYSEGFLAPRPSSSGVYFDNTSDFISIDELIYHETLDPDMISIVDFVKMKNENQEIPAKAITPMELSESLFQDGTKALQLVEEIQNQVDLNYTSISSELKDIETWSYLSLYFSEKLKAGVALQTYRMIGDEVNKTKAIEHLQSAMDHWKQVVRLTEDRYRPVPHVSIPEDSDDYKAFSWAYFLPQVERDIEIAKTAQILNNSGKIE